MKKYIIGGATVFTGLWLCAQTALPEGTFPPAVTTSSYFSGNVSVDGGEPAIRGENWGPGIQFGAHDRYISAPASITGVDLVASCLGNPSSSNCLGIAVADINNYGTNDSALEISTWNHDAGYSMVFGLDSQGLILKTDATNALGPIVLNPASNGEKLRVDSNLITITGPVQFDGGAFVSRTDFRGTIYGDGGMTQTGAMNLSGTNTLSGANTLSGNTTSSGNLLETGTLSVTGASGLYGAVTMDGGFTAAGSTINGALTHNTAGAYFSPGATNVLVLDGGSSLCLNGNTCTASMQIGPGLAAIGVPSADTGGMDLRVNGAGSGQGQGIRIHNQNLVGTADTVMQIYPGTSGTGYGAFISVNAQGLYAATDNGPIIFAPGVVEAGRIGSTGLTLGTTNAAAIAKWGNCGGNITVDFSSISAQTCQTLTKTCTGSAVNDTVALGQPAAIEDGLAVTAWVSSTSILSVRACNVTSGAIDPASATYTARWFH